MELVVRIELTTSPLPRECSTTELHEPATAGLQITVRLSAPGVLLERETGFEPATFSLGS